MALATVRGGTAEPLTLLLSHLDGVRPYGKGHRARCPSCDSKRNDCLSIATGDDGRVLLHCFKGCAALDVVRAVGLELGDLFPQRITHATTPEERRRLQQLAKQAQWKAALSMAAYESRIAWIAAEQAANGDPLDDDDLARLKLAAERLDEARGVFDGNA